MRPLHALFVVLSLVFIGGVAWRLVESGNPPSMEEGFAAPSESVARASGVRSSEVLEQPEERPDQGRSSLELPPVAEVAAPSSAVRASGPKLSGRIVDTAGAPVAGARLRLVPSFTDGGVILTRRADDEGVPGWREAQTGGDGRFELRNVKSGPNALYVNASGFEPLTTREVLVPAGTDHDLGDVALSPGVVLTGRVVDANGRPVAGATLTEHEGRAGGFRLFDWNQGAEPLATTAADGTFRVDELGVGPWALLVRSDVHPSTVATGVTDRPGQETAGLEIMFDPGAEITGRVVDAPSASFSTLSVRAFPAGDDGRTEFDLTDGAPFEVRSAQVDAEGRFWVRGLQLDHSYRLSLDEQGVVSFGLFGRSVSERVVARSGDRNIELSYRPEAALTFRVVDAATGEALEDFQVSAGVGWAQPLFGEEGRLKTNHSGGIVRFGDLRPETSRDVVQLEIEAVGYAPYRRDDIRLAPASEYDLGIIELEPVPIVTVQVLDDASGKPVSGARVTLALVPVAGGATNVRQVRMQVEVGTADASFGSEGSRVATTDDDGLCELSSFQGEACTLTVKADGFAPKRTQELVLPTGKQHHEVVRLELGGAVVVSVVDAFGEAVAAEKVRQRSPTADPGLLLMGAGPSAVTDAEGRARFENLEPGLHAFALGTADDGLVMWSGGGRQSMAFRVESSGVDAGGDEWSEVLVDQGGQHELQLVAPTRLTLAGTILEAGTPLAGASLSLEEPAGDELGLPGMAMFGGGGPSARTSGRGEYEFPNVEEGEYELVVEHSSRAMPARFDVTVTSGRERFDIDLALTIVEGTVRDPFGEPIAGVTVRASKSGNPQRQVMFISSFDGGGGSDATVTAGLGDSGGRVTTDADGNFELRGVLADVPLVIKAEGRGMQPAESEELELFEGQLKRNIDLEMVEGGALAITVLSADGEAAEQVFVQAHYIGDVFDGVRPETGVTGPTGMAAFDGLAPGPWRVTATVLSPGGMDFSNPDAESSVELEQGGESPVQLTLP